MKKIIIIFLTIILYACESSNDIKKESLYFIYQGRLSGIYRIRNVVLKNDSTSYVDTTLMYIGKPFELQIGNDDFQNLIKEITPKYLLDTNRYGKYGFGITIIHYIDNKRIEKYSFCNAAQINYLVSCINKTFHEEESKKKLIEWIIGAQRLYMQKKEDSCSDINN